MTTDQNKELVIRFNKEFIEGGNMNTLNELLAPDFINHTAPPGVSKGPDGVAYFFNNILKAAFPDLTVEILDQIAEGNKVATRKCFHATHKGDFFGVPASNKKVTIDVMDIIYLRDGKAVEHWANVDMQSLMMQITG
ncbi:MAG: ester cyclase [Bacteroidota bacterium]|nr:ester cyclase [Flavisolibacter sp.]MDQ3847024.1 ester cyclase [Bacteroidota bacterium]